MKNINFNNIDCIYHISDKDLDGYTSQLMTKEYIKSFNKKQKKNIKIKYFNPQREEILGTINNVFSEIVQDKNLNYLILITDLSLDDEHIKKMNNFKKGNRNINIEYQLLDHHISGEPHTGNEWYYLDLENCSAKITYLFYEKNFEENSFCKELTDLVQVKDLWIKDNKYFNKATFLSDKLTQIHYPEFFKENEIIEKFWTVKYLGKLLISNKSLQECEKDYIDLKCEFYNLFLDKKYADDTDLSSDSRKIYYFYSLFKKIENKLSVIKIDGFRTKILYNIEPYIFQVLSSLHLEHNEKLDIMINVSPNGKLSLRCNNDVDGINLSEISHKYFNGGGHAKAAGGKIDLIDKVYSQSGIEKIIKFTVSSVNLESRLENNNAEDFNYNL